MNNFIDHLIDSIVETVCHEQPFNDLVECMLIAVDINSAIVQVTMNDSTYKAIKRQLNEEDITTVNGLHIGIDDTLPDNVYKFD